MRRGSARLVYAKGIHLALHPGSKQEQRVKPEEQMEEGKNVIREGDLLIQVTKKKKKEATS